MKRLIAMLVTLVAVVMVQAQDFSDEDLTKYATVMKWAEEQKAELGSTVRDSVSIWLDESGVLTPSLYNDLSKAKKKDALAEVEATDEELSVFNSIQERIDQKTTKFKETYTTKIKEDIGAGLYNDLRKALKSDTDLKARYQGVFDGLDADTVTEADTEAGS